MVNKIDFHIHTIADSLKDTPFDFSIDWLEDYVKKSRLSAIAITNHNLFDQDNFDEIVNYLDIEVFPGMELNLCPRGQIIGSQHVNIIGKRDDKTYKCLNEISEVMKNRVSIVEKNGKDKDKAAIPIDEFLKIEGIENFIYIYEHGKSNSYIKGYSELSNCVHAYGVNNQFKFHILENKYKNLRKVPVLFSDAHATYDKNDNRHDIEKLKNHATYVQTDSPTFTNIKYAIRDNHVGINKSLLNNIVSVNGVNVSTGLNLIVGRRGTGKSYFVNDIYKINDADDVEYIKQFETTKLDEFLNNKIGSIRTNEVDKWLNDEKNKTTLDSIKKWMLKDELPSDFFQKYLNKLRTHVKSLKLKNSANSMALSSATNLGILQIDGIKSSVKNLKSFIDNDDIWNNYLINTKENKKFFIETYEELRNAGFERSKKNRIRRIVNDLINDVRKTIENITGIERSPSGNFINPIMEHNVRDSINKSMNIITESKQLYKRDIDGYKITVNKRPFQNAKDFNLMVSHKESIAKDLIPAYIEGDFVNYFKIIKEKRFYNADDLGKYLVYSYDNLITDNGSNASGGQATAFALLLKLKDAESKDIVLIDEPEASLDNDFIKNKLVKRIKNLSKKSTVFVITHNSTLGALLKPDYLIVTKYVSSEKKYLILSGEFNSGKITLNGSESENSYNYFIDAMEAGIDTYREKGENYKNLKEGESLNDSGE